MHIRYGFKTSPCQAQPRVFPRGFPKFEMRVVQIAPLWGLIWDGVFAGIAQMPRLDVDRMPPWPLGSMRLVGRTDIGDDDPS